MENLSLGRGSEVRGAGLRLQIVLALAILLIASFVPLFLALARLTEQAMFASRAEGARALGRVIATEVADARQNGSPEYLREVLGKHVQLSGAVAIAVFGKDRERLAESGRADSLAAPVAVDREATTFARIPGAPALDVAVPARESVVVVRMGLGHAAEASAIAVRSFALYMIVFAVALLVFAYFALTRLIVRPLDRLVRAADRVAGGSHSFDPPEGGPRELLALGHSLKQMTRKLRDGEENLRKQLAEIESATQSLRDTRSQLAGSDRLASVGRLAAGVAHEIGNPITAIMGLQELLLSDEFPREEEKDFLDRMRRETERVHVIVKDLLAFARSKDESPESLEPGNVREAVESVIALLRPQRGMKQIEISSSIGEVPAVRLPTGRLTQVLLNLALNARDAMTSVSEEGTLRFMASSENGQIRIRVEDSGPGIEADVAVRMFEPFFTTKDIGQGTGLGLSVCKGLVEAVGGTIGVDLAYSGGACVVVVLPIAK